MMNRLKTTAIIIVGTVLLSLLSVSAVKSQNIERKQFINVETGAFYPSHYNAGFRFFVEHQKMINRKWSRGFSFENMHSNDIKADKPNFNMTLLSLNYYYRINFIKDKLYCNFGLGAGIAHSFWAGYDKYGFAVTPSMVMTIKINHRWSIQTSPLLIVGPNRYHYSTIKFDGTNNADAISALPIGVKFNL